MSGFFPNSVTQLIVGIGPDFGESDVLGYEKIAGDLAATELTRQLFLSGRPRDIYFVILDEMNLAHVDHYLARLLPAIESDAPVELPGQQVQKDLPPDTFVVGTINSFIEEPTRLALSGPVKRRANVIEMPNLLAQIIADNDRPRFVSTLVDLLTQTRGRYESRRKLGLGSVFDDLRIGNLTGEIAEGSRLRADKFVDPLWRICQICAQDSQTSLTFGVVQDVATRRSGLSRPSPHGIRRKHKVRGNSVHASYRCFGAASSYRGREFWDGVFPLLNDRRAPLGRCPESAGGRARPYVLLFGLCKSASIVWRM
jgi:hypothetical protein